MPDLSEFLDVPLGFSERQGRCAEKKYFRVAFFVLLCLFCFLAISCTRSTDTKQQRSPAETKPRPPGPPKVTQIDDAKIKELLKPNGKPLLVNFWATWCVPCREEFPDLVKIDDEYYGKIDFITVSLDFMEELDTGVPKFLTEMKAGMPTYLLISADENTLISSISADWKGGLPFTILYNSKGDVAFTRQGKVDPDTLRGEIEKTLNEK